MGLKDKVAIVTGGAQGIGAAYCIALAKAGANVAVTDILDGSAVAEAVLKEGDAAFYTYMDVTDPVSIRRAVEAVVERYGRIDVLVNNAAIWGAIKFAAFEDLRSEDWDRVYAVNVKGVFLVTQAVVPYMKKLGAGRVINITSSAVYTAPVGIPHYISSKSALIGLTRALARELGPANITVNCLAPGLTLSEGSLRVMSEQGKSGLNDRSIANRCLQRSMYADDILGALLFLCGEESSFVTGQELNVDGGTVFK